jgi:ABC-type proline/glycine betaine transport system permease subunit
MKHIYVVLIHYVLLFAAIFGIKYWTETPNTNCGTVIMLLIMIFFLYVICGFIAGIILSRSDENDYVLNYMTDAFNFFKYLKI